MSPDISTGHVNQSLECTAFITCSSNKIQANYQRIFFLISLFLSTRGHHVIVLKNSLSSTHSAQPCHVVLYISDKPVFWDTVHQFMCHYDMHVNFLHKSCRTLKHFPLSCQSYIWVNYFAEGSSSRKGHFPQTLIFFFFKIYPLSEEKKRKTMRQNYVDSPLHGVQNVQKDVS